MSGGASKSKSNSNQQATSTQQLDPQIKQALLDNYGHAQGVAANSQYNPLSAGMIQNYQNPYTQQVIDTTNADIARQGQINGVQGDQQAAAAGAFGGSRSGVMRAQNDAATMRTQALTDATLRSQGFDKAATLAQGENQNQNNWPLILQQLLNSSLGLAGNPVLGNSQSTGSSSGSSFGFQGGFKAG